MLAKLATVTLLFSLGIAAWLGYELGLLGFTRVFASEEKTVSSDTSTKPVEGDADSLHRSLDAKAKQLDAREAEVLKRERQAADKETLFVAQLEKYEALVRSLRGRVEELESLNLAKVEGFKRLYEKMDVKKVARVLEATDAKLAAEILGEMKPQLAAEVLGKMSDAKVRSLTEKYLSKRKTASSRTKGENPDQKGGE